MGMAAFQLPVFLFFSASFTALSTDLTQVRRGATAHQSFGTEVPTHSLLLL